MAYANTRAMLAQMANPPGPQTRWRGRGTPPGCRKPRAALAQPTNANTACQLIANATIIPI
eukprot:7724127-Lingulodinium_polyedra.AAC.1